MEDDDTMRENRDGGATTTMIKPHEHVCSKPSPIRKGSALVSRIGYANKATHRKGAPWYAPT
jgi:hypothetical protein